MSMTGSDITNLGKSIEGLEEKIKNKDYVYEWKCCQQVDNQYNASHFSTAILDNNIEKNRYCDVLANEETRVKLIVQEETDYINANYISHKVFPRTQTDYIATQGPLYATVTDFWLMCIQQRVSLIVMLCNTVEAGKEKCACYWPNAKNEVASLITSDKRINIENLEENIIPRSKKSIIHRKFKLTFDNEERIIDQLQYIGWSDHGVPSTTSNFRLLCKEVIKLRATKQNAPVVVHCSAGIGRTGTFLTVCILTEQMKNYREQELFEFKIMETIQSLKKLRKGMVQTPSQYHFAYIAILEEAKSLTLLNAKKCTGKARKPWSIFNA